MSRTKKTARVQRAADNRMRIASVKTIYRMGDAATPPSARMSERKGRKSLNSNGDCNQNPDSTETVGILIEQGPDISLNS